MNRKLFVLALIIIALVVPASLISAQGDRTPTYVGGFNQGGGRGMVGPAAAGSDLLYSQIGTASTAGLWSMDVTDAAYENYTAQSADDFMVSDAGGWDIDRVYAYGFYDISGSLPYNVYFYADSVSGGSPGALVCSYAAVTPTQDVMGEVTIDLPNPCHVDQGVNWVSVQAITDNYWSNPWWYWGHPVEAYDYVANWQNPLDGFGTGCTGWCAINTIVDYTDQIFELYGYVGEATEEEEAEELPDGDGDGVADRYDNCLYIANSWQEDSDGDGIGDACDYPVSVLLGCPNDILTYMGYSGAGGDVACRETLAGSEWDVPAAPSGHSYAMDPAYEAYYTVFGIDAESGSGMTSMDEPVTICFDGGMGATAIGVYYDDWSTGWEGTWMMLDTFEMNGNLCAASTQLGYFAAFTG